MAVEPYFEDAYLTLYGGDCREVMAAMEPESVHCVVTSPPYWGLRDYGTATWEGGDPACDHIERRASASKNTLGRDESHKNRDQLPATNSAFVGKESAYRDTCRKCGARRVDAQLGLEPTPEEYVANMVAVFREVRRVLRDDGTLWLNLGDSYATGTGRNDTDPANIARRNAKYGTGTGDGQGPRDFTPMRHPTKPKDLVGIPWRVAFALQADGWVLRSEVIWNKPNPMPESVTDRPTKSHEQMFLFSKGKRIGPEPTPWDDIMDSDARWLAGIVDTEGSIIVRRESPKGDDYGAHAAQVSVGNTSRALLEEIVRIVGSGSILERDGQNAPMHYWQASNKVALGILRRIYPFLIVKQRQARCAIALEEGKRYPGGHARIAPSEVERRERLWQAVKSLNHFGDPDLSGIPEPVFGRWTSQPYYYDADAVREPHDDKHGLERFKHGGVSRPEYEAETQGWNGGGMKHRHRDYNPAGRNLRSVWTIATEPYPGAHFATFPRKLVEPCVKAGTSERGVCPECGAPWERVVERTKGEEQAYQRPKHLQSARSTLSMSGGSDGWERIGSKAETTGWRPSCAHDAEPVPAVVLDPFAGSGTTLLVAQALGRKAVGIDLNPEYVEMAVRRGSREFGRGKVTEINAKEPDEGLWALDG